MSTTEQFETWLSLKYGGSRLGMWMKENGEYGVPSVQLRWEAWQASRAAVEIAIPDRIANINLFSHWGLKICGDTG